MSVLICTSTNSAYCPSSSLHLLFSEFLMMATPTGVRLYVEAVLIYMTLVMMGVKSFFKVAIGYFLCKLYIQFMVHLLLAVLSPCCLISAVVCNLTICSLSECGCYSSTALLLVQLIVPFAVQRVIFT